MQKIDSEKLNFSNTAVQHFNKVLDDRGKGLGIKIGVKKAGCSGYEYTFGFVDELNSDFIAFEVDGCKIFVDSESASIAFQHQVEAFENKGLLQAGE